MHHDVSAPVARLLAGVRARPPWRHRSGLTLVPLDDARGPRWTGLPSVRSELEVGETVPPRPGALLVANRGPGAVAVHTGDLFTGGLADRAAQAAALVGPGEEQVVSAEAVEARWWWPGPPVLRGTLDPPLAALVALAGLDGEGRGGLSAIARTGLWALGSRPSDEEDPPTSHFEPITVTRGWMLLSAGAVLALRVWSEPRAVTARGASPLPRGAGDEAAARRFLAAIAAAPWTHTVAGPALAEVAGHHAHAVLHEGRVLELSTLRLSTELADALLRAGDRVLSPAWRRFSAITEQSPVAPGGSRREGHP